jgi:hypothetical protein
MNGRHNKPNGRKSCKKGANWPRAKGRLMKKKVTFQLEPEIADWLAAQPGGGEAWLSELVRKQLKPAHPPAEQELSGDAKRAIALCENLEPGIRQRVLALVRYPQLIDAVARGYVSVERAEEMAEEADARASS